MFPCARFHREGNLSCAVASSKLVYQPVIRIYILLSCYALVEYSFSSKILTYNHRYNIKAFKPLAGNTWINLFRHFSGSMHPSTFDRLVRVSIRLSYQAPFLFCLTATPQDPVEPETSDDNGPRSNSQQYSLLAAEALYRF